MLSSLSRTIPAFTWKDKKKVMENLYKIIRNLCRNLNQLDTSLPQTSLERFF
jgi:hypothetical protein